MPYYPPPSAGGSGYTTVQDEGTPLTARSTLNFVGAGVTASDTGGVTQVSISGGGAGSTNVGKTTVNFGGGGTDATATVTGQASIGSSSVVQAFKEPLATASNTADDTVVEALDVTISDIVPGTGFTVRAVCQLGKAHGIHQIGWSWN